MCFSVLTPCFPDRFSFSLPCSWITRWLLIWHWSPWWTKQRCCKVLSWFSVPQSPLLSWCLVQSSSIWRGFSSVSFTLALADGHRNTIHLPGIPASACLMHTTTRMTHCCVWGCWMQLLHLPQTHTRRRVIGCVCMCVCCYSRIPYSSLMPFKILFLSRSDWSSAPL